VDKVNVRVKNVVVEETEHDEPVRPDQVVNKPRN
jgi:hypothetical protein